MRAGNAGDSRPGPNASPSSIAVEGVGKRYIKLDEQAMLLRSVLPAWRPSRTEFWAIRDVDLTIAPGETVGVIGRNGAGKTTLLRLLAGVTRPTIGRVRVSGRVAPLISVGVGFHSEMSGRENVYINGMLLGLSRREVDERFEAIVDFAELEDFIDTPVKFYSSGMFLRLGFSVAIHVDPDILLVDEILAVGDVAFQLKCFDRMREVQAGGTTILLVSHSLHAIRLLCPRAIVLDQGRLEFDGETGEAVARHHELLNLEHGGDGGADGNTAVEVVRQEVLGAHGPTTHLTQGEPAAYRVRLRFRREVASPHLVFRVLTPVGTLAYEMKTPRLSDWRTFVAAEEADVVVHFRPALGGGSYRLTLDVHDQTGRTPLFHDPHGTLVYLAPPPGTDGFADLEAGISVDGAPVSRHPDLLLRGTSSRRSG